MSDLIPNVPTDDERPGDGAADATAPEDRPPLTAITLGPAGALGLGVYTIVLNVVLATWIRSGSVVSATHRLIEQAGVALSVSQADVAAVLSGIAMLLAYALVLLPTLLLVNARGVRFRDAVGLRPMRIGPLAGAAFAVIVFALCLVVPYGIALRGLGVNAPGNTSELVRVFGRDPLGVAILFVLGSIVAPFVEEVTFRGIVYPSLGRTWGVAWAVVVSSVLFGLAHLELAALVPTAVIGALLAITFTKTRSLWASIAAHGAYNACVLAFALLLRTAVG